MQSEYNSLNKAIKDTDLEHILEGETKAERIKHAEENNIDELIELVTAYILLSNKRAIDAINAEMEYIYYDNYTYTQNILSAARQAETVAVSTHTRRAYDRQTNHKHISKEVRRAFYDVFSKGRGIKDIYLNLRRVAGRSRRSALATARTETFRVANMARYNIALEAYAAGINSTKTWVHRDVGQKTFRDWHVEMSGETVHVTETFSNGLMMPHEDGAPANETINCRCIMQVEGEVENGG